MANGLLMPPPEPDWWTRQRGTGSLLRPRSNGIWSDGVWFASEAERKKSQRQAERARKERERRQAQKDTPTFIERPWESVRDYLEPETPGEMAALIGPSFTEPLGTAIDLADFAAGFQDRDLSRMGVALASAVLPGATAAAWRASKKGSRAADRAPDTTVRPRERRGIEGIPEAGQEGRGIKSVRDLPLEEALGHVRRGAHIVRKADGSYVGAPNWIKSEDDLEELRRQLDQLAEEGVQGKDWYDRAEAGNLAMAGPYRERTALLGAEQGLWSPQANPDVNLGAALLGHNAYELGAPLGLVRTTRQAQAYNTARDAGLLPDLGSKTGIYGELIDPLVETPITGANDVWHGRAFGYDETESLSPQAHAFMDGETLLAAERLNAQGVGGFNDWDAGSAQAAMWVRKKGADLAEKRFGGDLQRGMNEAEKTYPDYFRKYGYNVTHEAVPGRGTGHLPALLDEPWEVREAYTDAVPWTTATGQDAIHDALGFYNIPGRHATGYYMGETNPVRVAIPMLARGYNSKSIDPLSLQSIRGAEALRGLLDAQNEAAGHRVVTDMAAGQQRFAFNPLDAPVDPDLLHEAAESVGTHFPVDTGEGVTWMPMNDAARAAIPDSRPNSRDVLKSIRGGDLSRVAEILGSSGTGRVGMDSHEIPLLALVGSEQGTGVATRAMLAEIDKAVEMGAVNLPERLSAEPIRRRAIGLLNRDATLGPLYGGDRLDMENFRRLFGEGGLAEVRAGLLRGDYLPAVGLLGGYSALQGNRRLERERR